MRVLGLAVPVVVYRRPVMALFGNAFVPYASLLPGFALAMVAAVALGPVALLVRPLSVPGTPVVGTVLGLTAYASVLAVLGFDPVERRLVRTLARRYRRPVPAFSGP